MNICTNNSIPKHSLSATNQATRALGDSQKNFEIKQLTFWEAPQQAKLFQQKPQISHISGAHPRERHRYRVMLGNEVLGDRLTIDEALKLAAKGGAS